MAATTLAMRRVWASLSAASLPISSATTRKAAPWVPARAASMVAFSASSLVLSATSLMTPEKVAISASCSARRSMRSRWAPMASTASTTRARTAAPCSTSAARSPHMRADCSPARAASSAPLCSASTATATPSSSVRM